MKHSLRITMLLLGMFLITQIIGLVVVHQYAPQVTQVTNSTGQLVNVTTYDLPYGTEPPQDIEPQSALVTIIMSLIIGIVVVFLLMKFDVETFLRLWFFVVVTLAISITLTALSKSFVPYASTIAIIIALPLAFLKVFKRYIIAHNLTELVIYPGVAAIIIPYLRVWSVAILLVLISLYDMYAVWHAGFMQKMANYQIKKLRFFTGFFIPYRGAQQKAIAAKATSKAMKAKGKDDKKVKVNVAILGGGDVVFPIITAGVVYIAMGLLPALCITLGATAALGLLFYYSEKGKFYPAMPFISAGCFVGLLVAYLI